METEITKFTDTQYKIIKEILVSLDKLGAKYGIVTPIASWGDTLSDAEVLEQLEQINAKM